MKKGGGLMKHECEELKTLNSRLRERAAGMGFVVDRSGTEMAWHIKQYHGGVYLVSGIKFCPFCGLELR